MSEDERHTKRRTTGETVLVTILAEDGFTVRKYPPPRGGDKVKETFRVERGDAVHVRPQTARAWIDAEPPKAVLVDQMRIGAAQRELLLKLYDRQRQAAVSPNRAWRLAARRGSGPSGSTLHSRRGIRWSPESLHDGPLTRSASASLSRALRHLERRGLVLRDAPTGSGKRTRTVQVTQAGVLVAQRLLGEA